MLLLSWSFVSCDKCIYEDLSTCPLRVQLRYDYNMQYVDRWHREAEDVHLYIFDEAGRFVSEMIDAAAPYEEKQTFELQLAPGNYTIMALCGHRMGTLYKESKLQVGTSTMQDLLVEISRTEDKRIAAELPPLLYGVSKDVMVLTRTDARAVRPYTGLPVRTGYTSSTAILSYEGLNVPLIGTIHTKEG